MNQKQKRASAAAIREAIKKAGSQAALADLTSISQGELSKLARGHRVIGAEGALRISKAVGIPVVRTRPDLANAIASVLMTESLRKENERNRSGRGAAPAL